MKYQLKQIYCRPWTLSGLSLPLIESHYENNYGGALRRLNAITEQLESLDMASTPGHVINGLKREELAALNSTLLHELYFASMGGDGKMTSAMSSSPAAQARILPRVSSHATASPYRHRPRRRPTTSLPSLSARPPNRADRQPARFRDPEHRRRRPDRGVSPPAIRPLV